MRCYVLMGVSGCGKSSVGAALSASCGMTFVDGDDLHPPANIAKMSQGDALTDADRAPWLADVGRALAEGTGPVVIGCSALRKSYRNIIRKAVPAPVHFLHLHAPKAVLAARVTGRKGHFMPASLLDSQYETLEPLNPDEQGNEIDIALPFPEVIAKAEAYVKETLI